MSINFLPGFIQDKPPVEVIEKVKDNKMIEKARFGSMHVKVESVIQWRIEMVQIVRLLQVSYTTLHHVSCGLCLLLLGLVTQTLYLTTRKEMAVFDTWRT